MKILFQGDSITDAGRNREDIHNLGNGYPKYAAEKLQVLMPDTEFEFFDLGISGNKTEDLVARWQTDCMDIAPDVLSILIGVNDTWHHAHDKSYLTDEEFERNYRYILDEAKKIPGIKIIIMEQFLLPNPDFAFFREDLAPKIEVTRKLAREYADVFIPLDGLLTAENVKVGDYRILSPDGVHPSEVGADFIGALWAEAAASILK